MPLSPPTASSGSQSSYQAGLSFTSRGADQVLPLFHATVPFAPVPTPIELRDVLRQALIVGINLESRKTKPKRQLGRRWKARRRKNLLAVQFWLQFLASLCEVPLGDAAELARMLETTPGTIYTNRVKIQVKVLALQRAGKVDLDVRSKRPKSELTPQTRTEESA